MPEGDTIFRAARALDQALASQIVTRFETRLAPLADLDRAEPFAGRTVERVEPVGKHILMWLSPDLVLRTHMRMHGSWHLYRPGERWHEPSHEMLIVIDTTSWTAAAFRIQVADVVRADALSRHRPLAALGPDLLGNFDAEVALARIRALGGAPVHQVLLDQRVLAAREGLGAARLEGLGGSAASKDSGCCASLEGLGVLRTPRRLSTICQVAVAAAKRAGS